MTSKREWEKRLLGIVLINNITPEAKVEILKKLLSKREKEIIGKAKRAFKIAEEHGTLPYPNKYGEYVKVPRHNQVVQEMKAIFLSNLSKE